MVTKTVEIFKNYFVAAASFFLSNARAFAGESENVEGAEFL